MEKQRKSSKSSLNSETQISLLKDANGQINWFKEDQTRMKGVFLKSDRKDVNIQES